MHKINDEQPSGNRKRFEELRGNEILLRKVVRIAQYESEVDLGVNPLNFEQANVGNLSEQDFEYIRRVCTLAEKRLQDSNWLARTLDDIENKHVVKRNSKWGIRFDDELFKAGRGILETYLKETEKDN